VVLYYEGLGNVVVDPDDHPTLRSMDGATVATRVDRPKDGLLILTPVSALEANSQYQVFSEVAQVPCMTRGATGPSYPSLCKPLPTQTLDGGSVDGGSGVDGRADIDGGIGASITVLATFTTGSGPDVVAPILGGSLSRAAHEDSCFSSACCGPYRACLVELTWDPANEDGDFVYYQLLTPDGLLLPMLTATRVAGQRTNGIPYLPGSRFITQAEAVRVVAVDYAGNTSSPIASDLPDTCNGGCSCRLGGASAGRSRWLAVAALALGIGRIGRRRRGPSSVSVVACGSNHAQRAPRHTPRVDDGSYPHSP
jgi:hypothetical protein